jgi:hypothetical protein
LLPSFSKALFRGLHTTTLVTCGFSKSYNHAAQVPSSNVTCTSAQPLDKLQNGHCLRFDDGLHDYLASGIHHRDRDRLFVNVHANKFRTFHYQVLLSS